MIMGAVVLGMGLFIALLEHGGFPRLPGDIVIRREGFTFYAPLGTMLLLSVILTIVLTIFRR